MAGKKTWLFWGTLFAIVAVSVLAVVFWIRHQLFMHGDKDSIQLGRNVVEALNKKYADNTFEYSYDATCVYVHRRTKTGVDLDEAKNYLVSKFSGLVNGKEIIITENGMEICTGARKTRE